MTSARVPIGTKLAYGFGAVAYGIKDNGFSAFLLLFYNHVVGLPAGQVGLIIRAYSRHRRDRCMVLHQISVRTRRT